MKVFFVIRCFKSDLYRLTWVFVMYIRRALEHYFIFLVRGEICVVFTANYSFSER
jgi:hypothetical protein